MGINEWRGRARDREAWRRIVKGVKAHPGGAVVPSKKKVFQPSFEPAIFLTHVNCAPATLISLLTAKVKNHF